MNEVAFTSELATNRIAGRAVRGMSAASMKAAHVVGSMMNPIAKQLYASGRGKMRRGELKLLCNNLHRRLQSHEGVLDLEYQILNGPLSTHETYYIRFLMVMGDDDEQWAEIVGVEASMTRAKTTMAINPTDILVHKHALARYMQRKRKPLEHFFESVVEPVYASVLLGNMSADQEHEHIALPMGDGLLLGRRQLTNANVCPPTSLVMTVDGHSRVRLEEVVHPTTLDGVRCQIKVMTYVDGDAMTESRARLHEELSKFMVKHRDGVRAIFETSVFKEKFIRAGDVPAMRVLVEEAALAAKEIVRSPVWHRFARSVGSKPVP